MGFKRRRHFPPIAESAQPHLALLDAIVEAQASLIARWQLVGFVHGVMNTDNMAVSGETIDYGPCAFLDSYDPNTVFSSIDHHGRYASGNQPAIAQWNLTRLAESMLPLLDQNQEAAIELATTSLGRFERHFESCWLAGMRAKLGLFTEEADDEALVNALLQWMLRARADFTNTFRRLSALDRTDDREAEETAFNGWYEQWRARLARQPNPNEQVSAMMRRSNPAFMPRNHKVEEALTAATEEGDLSVMERLGDVLASPYDYSRDQEAFSCPPEEGAPRYRTFCGT